MAYPIPRDVTPSGKRWGGATFAVRQAGPRMSGCQQSGDPGLPAASVLGRLEPIHAENKNDTANNIHDGARGCSARANDALNKCSDQESND